MKEETGKMEKHILSKSTFIRGVQCLKSLYLNKKRPFLRDKLPKERQLVFQRGHVVGELAQELFPGGINMSPGHPGAYRRALSNTGEKISEGFPVIYEAAFQYDGVLIFVDILVQTDSGWHAYEVKSSAKISDTYLMDAALQYYVIKGSGLGINGISLVHINKEYVRKVDLNPKELFSIVDVTGEALSRQEYVASKIIHEKEALNLSHSPKIDVGPHCREPYDCDFIGHCWKNKNVQDKEDGFEAIKKQSISDFEEMKDQRHAFIKILTMKRAIPEYEGTRPYQEIAYCYVIDKGDKVIADLFPHDINPEGNLISSLRENLNDIDIVVCLGQRYKLRELLGENIQIFDLVNIFEKAYNILSVNDGESLLNKIAIIIGEEEISTAYSSDAVCEHYYITDFKEQQTIHNIKDYSILWTNMIKKLYNHILNT